MISTKGRYSIRILLDLAEHRGVGYTPIKDVAARQSISLKYVEKLMPALKNAGLLDSSHGIGGGYRLNRDPEQYDLWEILRVTEGELAPVSCLQTDASPCQRAGECRTLSVWQGYYDLTRKYFSGITLADLMAVPQGDNYVICPPTLSPPKRQGPRSHSLRGPCCLLLLPQHHGDEVQIPPASMALRSPMAYSLSCRSQSAQNSSWLSISRT